MVIIVIDLFRLIIELLIFEIYECLDLQEYQEVNIFNMFVFVSSVKLFILSNSVFKLFI